MQHTAVETIALAYDSLSCALIGKSHKSENSTSYSCIVNQNFHMKGICITRIIRLFIIHQLDPLQNFSRRNFSAAFFSSIYGKTVKSDGQEHFEWSHSYSKIIDKKIQYDPKGVFMTFENYNVEVRERVKCISGKDGVPISTQWESQGYYYPTQIAQFALSHYSKYLIEPKSMKILIEDAEIMRQNWILLSGSKINRFYDHRVNSYVMNYSTHPSDSNIFLKLDIALKPILKLDISITDNSSITVQMQTREKKNIFYLHYVSNNIVLRCQDNHIFYGIGQVNDRYKHLTRDLVIDLQKGLNYGEKNKKKMSRSKLKVVKIVLNGSGMIDNITFSTTEHIDQFYDAANWFVNNQNITSGGWSNPVRRKVANGMSVLEPGWYSSMGQGHAISVLSRAYYHSGKKKYLQAAARGLQPFQMPVRNGGIVAFFLDKHIWYEEYPTTPSSFVLNGFIYSLIGLYDLKSVSMGEEAKIAERLFDQGIFSLKNMLTLFDTGSGTTYDLRHVTLKVAPNLARWDYHSTHVNQLLVLSSIDKDPIFTSTADRWLEYMSGKKAAHN